MRAIVQHGYGAPSDVLRLAEVDRPSVGDGEVLVRVVASSANPLSADSCARRVGGRGSWAVTDGVMVSFAL